MNNGSRARSGGRRRLVFTIAVVSVLGLLVLYLGFLRKHDSAPQYQVAQVTRGNIENYVTCTGTLSPVDVVEIGTEVSGTIDEIFVDFNDHVKKGAILAVLDTTLLKAAVTDAEGGLQSAQAQYDEAYAEYQRNQPLFEKGYVSDQEFAPIQAGVKTREATVRSARAALERAQANLRNAVIRSPIEGMVIQRNVEPGQTVAASFSTPTLFLIAKDLSQMEMLVAVDESDIGQVKEGQQARFTVQAYPEQTFSGVVDQIRLQPETVQNVVTYTVVVSAPNREGLLLPGMTATVDLLVEDIQDVLLVPNSALRLTPTEEMLAEARTAMQERKGAPSESTKLRRGAETGGAVEQEGLLPMHGGGSPAGSGETKTVWLLDEHGQARPRPVRVGATDGKMTELVGASGIAEGAQVIVGMSQSQEGGAQATSAAQSQRRPPGFRIF
jgi:HlyD family secretion protein